MCVGLPMKVVAVESPTSARCQANGEEHRIDTRLLPDLSVGDWVMTHLGAAREKIDETTARNAQSALDALGAIMAGQAVDIEAAFPDLVGREPTLPDHLLNQENT